MNETIITVVGNLTAAPELRFTQSGVAVVNFTVAATPRTFDKAKNEYVDGEALFLRCSAWREFAEHIAGSLDKGNRVIVQGKLRQRSYESSSGEKRTSVELDVDAIGADLRYATAQVTRAQSSRDDIRTSPQVEEPWAVTPPASGDDWDQTGMADVWNTPSSYTDETPF